MLLVSCRFVSSDCLAEPCLLPFFCWKGVGLRAADGDAMVAVGFRPRWPELPDVRTGEFSDMSFLMVHNRTVIFLTA